MTYPFGSFTVEYQTINLQAQPAAVCVISQLFILGATNFCNLGFYTPFFPSKKIISIPEVQKRSVR